MNSKWKKKRQEMKEKWKKKDKDDTFLDILFEILFYIPELFLLPFKLLIWFIRGCGKLLKNVLDFTP